MGCISGPSGIDERSTGLRGNKRGLGSVVLGLEGVGWVNRNGSIPYFKEGP